MINKLSNMNVMNLLLSETPEVYDNLRYRKDKENGKFMYIMAFDTNDMITLNHTALKIFEMCDGKTTIKEMVESQCIENSELLFEEVLESTLFCIRDMQRKGILYRGNPSIVSELGGNICYS